MNLLKTILQKKSVRTIVHTTNLPPKKNLRTLFSALKEEFQRFAWTLNDFSYTGGFVSSITQLYQNGQIEFEVGYNRFVCVIIEAHNPKKKKKTVFLIKEKKKKKKKNLAT